MQKHKSFFSRLLQGWKKLGPGIKWFYLVHHYRNIWLGTRPRQKIPRSKSLLHRHRYFFDTWLIAELYRHNAHSVINLHRHTLRPNSSRPDCYYPAHLKQQKNNGRKRKWHNNKYTWINRTRYYDRRCGGFNLFTVHGLD